MNTIKLATLAKMAMLYLQIRCLEATADGRANVLAFVAAEDVRMDMKIIQARLLAEITELKAEYRRIQRGNGITALEV